MSASNTSRHSPRSPAAPTEPDWQTHTHAAVMRDSVPNLTDQWLIHHGFTYSSVNGTASDFLNDTSLYSFGNFTSHLADLNVDDNALGLDLSTTGHTPSPHAYADADLYNMSPMDAPFPRQSLPQIITDGLETAAMTFPTASSREHSPYHLSAGGRPPLSAATSTPSSAGYNTIPLTPSSLPPASHLALPSTSGILLSPHSPYSLYSHFAQMSPKSPAQSQLGPLSPSVSSRADYADDDNDNRTGHTSIPITYQSVLDLASRYPHPDWIIPQKTYRPNTQSDRRRYVEEVSLEQPIMFFTQHPDGCGIPCRDALTSKFSLLVGRDDAMFRQRGPSVSIRINWPGYAPWSRQIPTRDFRSPPQPITRSKLAKNVAKTVQRFLEDMKDKPMEEDADPAYKVGPQHIRIEHLELIGLQHVSMGSWQAHLRLRRSVRES